MNFPPRPVVALTILTLSAGALFGCTAEPEAAPTTAPSATASPTPNATPTPTPTPEPTTGLSPLRGTEVDLDEIAGPALAAKIDNHWDARPQWGLEHTDIVYEELVEGGLTRYVAVWFSDIPKEIGPVRSIRPMDPEIVGPLKGIIAFSGGRAPFVRMIRDTDLHISVHGGKDSKYMYRSSQKRAPHNVVIEARKLVKAYKHIDPPQQQFKFATDGKKPSAVTDGASAKGLDISFSSTSQRAWRWSAKSKAYLRYQSGSADRDSSGDQLKAKNVLTLNVDVTYGEVPRTHLVGEGTGTLSTGGKTMKIRWSKSNRDARIMIRRGNEIVSLAPGNTWVELVPNRGSVKVVR